MKFYLSLCVGFTFGFLSFIALPVWAPVLASHYGISEPVVGWVVSLEMAILALSSFVLSQKVDSIDKRFVCLLGVAILVVCNVFMVIVGGLLPVLVLRALCGLGEGAIVVCVSAAAASTKAPEKTYAIMNVVFGVVGAAFLGLGPVLVEVFGGVSVFGVFAALGVISLPLIRWVSVLPPKAPECQGTGVPIFSGLFLFALFGGVFLLTVVDLGLWTYLDFKASRLNLGLGFRSITYSMCAILTIVGSSLPLWLGLRFGFKGPILTAALLSSICAVTVGVASSGMQLALGIVFLVFSFQVAIPYIMGFCAVRDPSGRLVAKVPGVIGAGQAVGPAVAGMLIGFGFESMGMIFSLFCLVGALLFFVVLRDNQGQDRGVEALS